MIESRQIPDSCSYSIQSEITLVVNSRKFRIAEHNIERDNKKSLKIPKGGNQNPYIEEEQTTQWPKEKVQKDKQRSFVQCHVKQCLPIKHLQCYSE